MKKITLPKKVNEIILSLEAAGYEAYAVGGCVRDCVLGREPQDWDITTSAQPNIVKQIFPRTIDTGIVHGTVTVMLGKEGYEVTTYRIDGEYEDARHPKEVTYTDNLLEDLRRRDFTINAMAYNDRVGFVDAFDGLGDLKKRVIRCVGEPQERFLEDALRMLRALRFAAQLDFQIEKDTYQAICELAPTISKISSERIQMEIIKMLTSNHPEFLYQFYESGIAKVVLPEFDRTMKTPQNNPHHQYNVGEHTIKVVENVPCDKVIRLAALFHDIAKPECRHTDENGVDHFYGHAQLGAEETVKIMRRLKFDVDTMKKVSRLVKWHDYLPNLTEAGVRRGIHKMGADCFPDIFRIKEADYVAQSTYQRESKVQNLEKFQQIYEKIIEQNNCLCLKDLKVDGRDLIQLGVKQGKDIGQILEDLLAQVLEDPSKNQREYLLDQVKKVYL